MRTWWPSDHAERDQTPNLLVVIPVVTPEQMRAIDAAAPEPVDVLVERAGAAVARAALRLMGGAYGRTVAVMAGGPDRPYPASHSRLHHRVRECGLVISELQSIMPLREDPGQSMRWGS